MKIYFKIERMIEVGMTDGLYYRILRKRSFLGFKYWTTIKVHKGGDDYEPWMFGSYKDAYDFLVKYYKYSHLHLVDIPKGKM